MQKEKRRNAIEQSTRLLYVAFFVSGRHLISAWELDGGSLAAFLIDFFTFHSTHYHDFSLRYQTSFRTRYRWRNSRVVGGSLGYHDSYVDSLVFQYEAPTLKSFSFFLFVSRAPSWSLLDRWRIEGGSMSRFDVNRARGWTRNSDVSSLGSFVPLLREYLRFITRTPSWSLLEFWRTMAICWVVWM